MGSDREDPVPARIGTADDTVSEFAAHPEDATLAFESESALNCRDALDSGWCDPNADGSIDASPDASISPLAVDASRNTAFTAPPEFFDESFAHAPLVDIDAFASEISIDSSPVAPVSDPPLLSSTPPPSIRPVQHERRQYRFNPMRRVVSAAAAGYLVLRRFRQTAGLMARHGTHLLQRTYIRSRISLQRLLNPSAMMPAVRVSRRAAASTACVALFVVAVAYVARPRSSTPSKAGAAAITQTEQRAQAPALSSPPLPPPVVRDEPPASPPAIVPGEPPASPPSAPARREAPLAASTASMTDTAARGSRTQIAPLALLAKPHQPATTHASSVASPSLVGSLLVTSEPDGAEVSVNGVVQGRTPLTIGDLNPGSRVISVSLPGYERWSWSVAVVANRQTPLAVKLRPER